MSYGGCPELERDRTIAAAQGPRAQYVFARESERLSSGFATPPRMVQAHIRIAELRGRHPTSEESRLDRPLRKPSVDTVRVDICYRPLRIGWAIRAGDIDAFRAVARVSFALGAVALTRSSSLTNKSAESLIDVFRVDMILPLGDSVMPKLQAII
jgi:hypothetical protein